jgi:chemotaxis family two-component system response regulator Rcp1
MRTESHSDGDADNPQPSRSHAVMIAEDNPADVFLIEEAIRAYSIPLKLSVAVDGEQAIKFIEGVEQDTAASCPIMLLLDLNLPIYGGFEVLQRLRRSEKCKHIPVVIVTSSDSPKDRAEAARLGANYYFQKTADYDQFLKIGEVLRDLLISLGLFQAAA